MANLQKLFTSFNGGVVSKYIEARPDIGKFFSSVRAGPNQFFMSEGGIRGRNGTRMVTSTRASALPGEVDGEAYLYRFQVSTANAYVIEFGDLYCRFFKNGAPIMDGLAPYEIETPYLIGEIPQMLATGARRLVDVLFLDVAGRPPMRLSRFSDTNWTLTEQKLDPQPSSEQDLDLESIVAISALAATAGATGVEIRSVDAPFLAADEGKEFIYSSGRASITTVVDTERIVVEIVDVFPLVSGTHFLHKLTTASGAGTSLTFSAAHGLVVGDYIERAAAVTGDPTGEVRRVQTRPSATQVTISEAFGANPNTGVGWYQIFPVAAGTTFLRGSPQTTFDVPAKEPIGKVMTGLAGAPAFRDSDVNSIIKLYGGVLQIITVTDTMHVQVKILSILIDSTLANPPAAPAGTWRLEKPIWSATRGFPTVNEFHQGRLMHAGSAAEPTKVAGSRTNNYSSYATGALATDAIDYTHASGDFNRIHWLLSAGSLFFGDDDSEVGMRGAGPGQPLGGDVYPEVIEQSFRGSLAIRPAKVSKSFLFVGANGTRIYRMISDVESSDLGKYKAIPANVLARDIELPGISIHPIAVMKDPFPIAFFKRSDGALLAFTNDDDEDVHAFSPWSTDGIIESYAIITHPDGDRDQIWLIVRRIINGATRRYIEIVEDDGHDTALCAYPQFHLDCAIKITKTDTTELTTLTGLEHLEAKTVQVMHYRTDIGSPQNPAYLGEFVVTGGAISLGYTIDYLGVFEIGLPYDCYVQTLRPAHQQEMTEGHTRKWVRLYLRLADSIPPMVDSERLTYEYAVDEDGLQLGGQGPKLSTGDFKVRSDSWHYDLEGYLTISRSMPGPFQVLAAYGAVDFVKDMN